MTVDGNLRGTLRDPHVLKVTRKLNLERVLPEIARCKAELEGDGLRVHLHQGRTGANSWDVTIEDATFFVRFEADRHLLRPYRDPRIVVKDRAQNGTVLDTWRCHQDVRRWFDSFIPA